MRCPFDEQQCEYPRCLGDDPNVASTSCKNLNPGVTLKSVMHEASIRDRARKKLERMSVKDIEKFLED